MKLKNKPTNQLETPKETLQVAQIKQNIQYCDPNIKEKIQIK